MACDLRCRSGSGIWFCLAYICDKNRRSSDTHLCKEPRSSFPGHSKSCPFLPSAWTARSLKEASASTVQPCPLDLLRCGGLCLRQAGTKCFVSWICVQLSIYSLPTSSYRTCYSSHLYNLVFRLYSKQNKCKIKKLDLCIGSLYLWRLSYLFLQFLRDRCSNLIWQLLYS